MCMGTHRACVFACECVCVCKCCNACKTFRLVVVALGLSCLFGSINSTCAEAEALSVCHKLEGSTERESV